MIASVRSIRKLAVLVAASVMVAITACSSTIQIRAGRSVDPALLDSALIVGKSTVEDVRRVMGDPDGKGREVLPTGQPPRTIWSYFYDASMGGGGHIDSRRMFVQVYLRGETYDGYLWFSSLLEHRRSL
jgi:hypothetical protein